MKNWIKKEISKDQVINLSTKYNIDPLTASIFARRNITNGNDILFYLENDLRFTHNPFLFNQMEDAVDRILDAIDEGEKVLIFGDRDVDGITSTTILYKFLKSLGLDVTYKVPVEDEQYGITTDVIQSFYENYGSLIITVDTGIASYKEVAFAKELGIDFIITDHHNIQENIPVDTIIINPKLPNSGYPFSEISGCVVAYKLINAIRFSKTDIYKQDICLLNAYQNEKGLYNIECVKLRNNVEKSRLVINEIDTQLKISDTKLDTFLKGQQIFTWDDKSTKQILKQIFGSSIEFNTFDLRNLVTSKIP